MNLAQRAELPREDRMFHVEPLELRDGEGGDLSFTGIASTVDQAYTVHDMFGEFQETMNKGAFDKTLKENDDVRLLVNHDGIPLARTKSDTLKLSTTPHLQALASLDAASPQVQTVRSAMKRKDLDQMSIGFRVTRQEWNGDYTERWIKEVKLFDVSVVTYPANPNTSASLRALLHGDHENLSADELRAAIGRLEALLDDLETNAEPGGQLITLTVDGKKLAQAVVDQSNRQGGLPIRLKEEMNLEVLELMRSHWDRRLDSVTPTL